MESAPHLAALDVNYFERSLKYVLRDVEHRAEANRMLAAADGEQATLEKATIKLLARFAVRQIKGNHQAASTHATDERLAGREAAEFIDEEPPHLLSVLDQV